jgi:tRNA pseudouridine55 synthase
VRRPRFEADGVLVVDKPSGPTSHDVVQVARRTFGARVGHTGTLDPLASGVLPLVVGRATRLAQFMTGAEKSYDATIVFGRETDTYDAAGRVTAETGRAPEPGAVAAAVTAMPGRRLQTPPIYSAKKIGGEPSHRLARRATPVAPAPVEVEIHEARLVSLVDCEARLLLRVSSGFYVRSLAHDLGVSLGVGAHLAALRRTHSGPFALADAVAWADVAVGAASLQGAVIPLEQLLTDLPTARLDADAVDWVRHGRQVAAAVGESHGTAAAATGGPVRLLDPDGRLVGIGTTIGPAPVAGESLLHPAVVLG